MMNPHPEIPLVLGRALRNARLKHMPAGQIIFYEQDLPQEVQCVLTAKLYRSPSMLAYSSYRRYNNMVH